jgi:predicted site-specific integrase-resolvase
MEAAAKVGISRATLHAWMAAGKVRAPKTGTFGFGRVRRWTVWHIAELRRVKERIYRKQMGRPKGT